MEWKSWNRRDQRSSSVVFAARLRRFAWKIHYFVGSLAAFCNKSFSVFLGSQRAHFFCFLLDPRKPSLDIKQGIGFNRRGLH